ncbi:MAG: hypothetical protein E7176_00570 [Erysipelotrichaceae bacterium]|nr:hypothetical protein [Erysipelotrichaceae bacterium]
MNVYKLKKYILPIIALAMLVISSILYLCIQNTAMSIVYMFLILVVIALLTYYLFFSKENENERDKG